MKTSSLASALATATPTYVALSDCASICAVLEMISGPALREAIVVVDAVSRGGYGRESYGLPVGRRSDLVDPAILQLFEQGGDDWAAFVRLAPRDRSAAASPVRLNALMVAEVLPRGVDHEGRSSLPSEAIATTAARFGSALLSPSAIIVGGGPTQGAGVVVAALYALTSPIDVSSDDAQRDALDLMRRLAFAVGADGIAPGVALADLSVPLPGTAVRELLPHHQLIVSCLVSDRRYAVDDVRAFLLEE